MKLHFLGICGTFMGSLAIIARELGHDVAGSDANVYPPMSTQLETQGIALFEGYHASHLQPAPDLVIVGNAMARGNPAVEYMLDAGLRYVSGPQWLRDHVLFGRHVLALSGTHGKTSTSAMLAWVLEQAGLQPGYLIGGVPVGLPASARLGAGNCFVVEADEYDTAFFDKRSKFVHYQPRTLVINNLEYDHADIFPDLGAIQRQFHHLVRTVPGKGLLVVNGDDANVAQVLALGCWTPVQRFAVAGNAAWTAADVAADGSRFTVRRDGQPLAEVRWQLLGRHNVNNALAVIAAADHAGVTPERSAGALSGFGGVRRRLELLGCPGGVRVYDDFAHHPTAIATTLDGLRRQMQRGRILAVIEPRSNTMRMGAHRGKLAASAAAADRVLWYQGADSGYDLAADVAGAAGQQVCGAVDAILAEVAQWARPGDAVVIMSNGGFEGIHQRLLAELSSRERQHHDE